jgi:hypothetical protein
MAKGRTLRQLLRFADLPSNYVKLTVLTKNGKGVVRGGTLTRDKDGVRRYEQRVEPVGGGVKLSSSGQYLKVRCSCDRHKYMWEAALNRVGAADIKYSNGELPYDTNPAMTPGICKHLRAVLVAVYNKNM